MSPVTVHATTFIRELRPVEGWHAIEDKPREFPSRGAAELYITGMRAADEAAAKRKGEHSRTFYEIREEPQL